VLGIDPGSSATGFGVVERVPSLKRLAIRHAMGTLGTLPRLLRGEKL